MKAPLLTAIACAAAIAPLAALAYSAGPAERLDLRVLTHLTRDGGRAHDLAATLVNLGGLAALLVMLAAVCALGVWWGRKREAIAAVVVVAGANLTTQLLKTALEHVRHTAIEHGVELPWANSFPSGHTTAAASIGVALLLVVPARHRLAALLTAGALTAAVAVSVVVLAWHYPSDVFGGILVVGAWGFAALAFLRFRAGRDRVARTEASRPPRPLAVSTD